jgi:hypothetical protein
MNIYLLLPLIQAVFSLALVPIALKGHRRSLLHSLFSFFLVGQAIWALIIFAMRSSPNIEYAYFWEKLLVPVGPFTSVLFYHFSIRYTGVRERSWLLGFLYFICVIFIPLSTTGLVFSGMQVKPYGYAPIFGPAGSFHLLFCFAVFIMALLTFVKDARTSLSAEQRNRVAYIILAMIISLVGATFDVLPVLGLPLYPGLIIGNIIFCLLTTVAIVRHNLLDIRVIMRLPKKSP